MVAQTLLVLVDYVGWHYARQIVLGVAAKKVAKQSLWLGPHKIFQSRPDSEHRCQFLRQAI